MKDQILDKLIRFDKLLGLTAISIALVAAFFSVYGIATLFAGYFVLTAFMASTLEIGKLVAVTYLYRYWQRTTGFLKTYLSVATLVLMLITSLGIFGFLSAAYQKSSMEFKANQEKIAMIEGQKSYLNDKIAQSKSRIDTLNDMRRLQESRMNESMTNAFLTRTPIQFKQIQDQTAGMIKTADANIEAEQQSIQKTTDDIAKIDQQVNDMRFASASKKDIRTFQFVADQFGTTLDKVAKWFILTIIFVFDPLAVALILAYNVATYREESPVIHTGGRRLNIVEPFTPKPFGPPEPFIPELSTSDPISQEPIKSEKQDMPDRVPQESTNSKKEEKVEIIDSSVTSGVGLASIDQQPSRPRPTWLQ